ncbi:hypothetical protein BOX15_Mlig013568g1, partial [Macrostomum lignano]
HVAPVVQVLFNRSKAQVISFSKDKVLRIWDVQLQVCLQRLAGIFPKGQEVSTRFFMHEDTGRLLLSFNSAMTLLAMKAEIRDRVLSHDMPVIGAVLNEKLGQLVSGCQAGCLTFWLLESGQRLRQMPDAHGSAEVTALATDPGADRFYTGATDGFVRVWDWGGHLYHELNCNSISSSAEVSQVLALKQGVVAAGFSKNVTMFKSKSFRERRVEPSEWKEQDVHQDEILSLASCPPHSLITAGYDGVISVWNSSSESCTRQLMQRCSQPPPNLDSEGRSSRSSRRRSAGKGADEAEASFTVTRLRVLDTRKPRARGSANLVSCGANGFVRFWNLHQGALVAEFLAHTQASSIIMEVSPDCQHLVTADGGGFIKVWHIADYCLDSAGQQAADGEEEPLVTERPALESEWQAHSDQINDIRLTERQDRLLIVTASSDCSLSLWDSFGNLIGTFGQEEHWKIEPLSVVLERLERERQEQELEDDEPQTGPPAVDETDWSPDERAVTDPKGFRISAWNSSLLGSRYAEAGSGRRQRRQPETLPDLAFIAQDRHTPAIGPFNSLSISDFTEMRDPKQPDFLAHPDVYFRDKEFSKPLPVQTAAMGENKLQAQFDDRTLLPKYVLDYETQIKKYQAFAVTNKEKEQPQSKAGARRPSGQVGLAGQTVSKMQQQQRPLSKHKH